MNLWRRLWRAHYERKIVKALIEAKIRELTQEKLIIERRPEGCLGYDCETCRCDLGD